MKKILLAVILLSSFAACKKDTAVTEPTPQPVTCQVNNTTIPGIYKITAIKYKASASAAEQDFYAGLQACKKDDTYELQAGGGLISTDAGVSCGLPPGPGSINGWSLESNNTILKIGDDTYSVESFNCNSLIIYQADISTAGDKKTTTYTKQ